MRTPDEQLGAIEGSLRRLALATTALAVIIGIYVADQLHTKWSIISAIAGARESMVKTEPAAPAPAPKPAPPELHHGDVAWLIPPLGARAVTVQSGGKGLELPGDRKVIIRQMDPAGPGSDPTCEVEVCDGPYRGRRVTVNRRYLRPMVP